MEITCRSNSNPDMTFRTNYNLRLYLKRRESVPVTPFSSLPSPPPTSIYTHPMIASGTHARMQTHTHARVKAEKSKQKITQRQCQKMLPRRQTWTFLPFLRGPRLPSLLGIEIVTPKEYFLKGITVTKKRKCLSTHHALHTFFSQ